MLKNVKKYLKTRMSPYDWIVVFVLIVGIFLRFYRFTETLMFQGDQGRDALVALEIIRGNPTLLGPVTSVGNMYLGPFYYYFMVPFLALTYPSPIGPALAVAVVNSLLLFLIWRLGREMVGKAGALVALVIMAVMPAAVMLSRFSWNPNLTPMVSFLLVYFLYRTWHDGKLSWLLWSALALGVLSQLHYVALIMIMPWLVVGLLVKKRHSLPLKRWLLYGGLSVLLYLISWLPLVVFDIRHQGIISQGFERFFSREDSRWLPQQNMGTYVAHYEGRGFRVLSQLMGSNNGIVDRIVFYGSLLVAGAWWLRPKKGKIFNKEGVLIVFLVMGATIAGIAAYSGEVYDHYLGFAMPIVALYFGIIARYLWSFHRLAGMGVVAGLAVWAWFSILSTQAFQQSGPSLAVYEQSVREMLAHRSPQGRYNLVLLGPSKDQKGMNYRYYFTVLNEVAPQSLDHYDSLDELLIIDEIGVENPTTYPIYEIVDSGLERVSDMTTLSFGQEVYWLGQ